jgi:putative flippase GtrA
MSAQTSGLFAWPKRLVGRALQYEKLRYLVTGGVNTAFAYGMFALSYYVLAAHVHYMFTLVSTTVLNITVAYVNHKFFVFRTRGNYLREYLRYYVVYAAPIALGFVVFPLGIEVLHLNAYLTQALNTVVTVVLSYLGHKHISFRPAR